MKKLLVLIIVLSAISICYAEKITVVTEEFPPFNFSNEQGEIEGLSTEIVKAVLEESGMDYEIRIYPWKRAYNMTLEHKNTILYSTSRRPSREDKFKWVGIIAPSKYSLFALKERNDINVKKLEDIKNYTIGTSQGDAREAYLKEKGFSDFIESVPGSDANDLNYKKLVNKRIDLWPMPDAVAYYLVKNDFKQDPNKILKKVLPLEDLSKGGYYIAINKDTSDEIVNKLQSALDKLKENGTFDMILKKWGM